MEVRRFLLFMVLSALILLGWQFFVVPQFAPPPARKVPAAADNERPGQADPVKKPAPDRKPDAAADAGEDAPDDDAPDDAAQADTTDDERREFLKQAADAKNSREVVLGSLKDDSRYFMRVTLDTRGAAIQSIQLGGERFRELDDPDEPLKLLQADTVREQGRTTVFRTFQTSFPAVDEAIQELFPDLDLASVNWDVLEQGQAKGADSVAFRFRLPGGQLEIIKRYTLHAVPANLDLKEARKEHTDGYLVHLAVTVRNVAEEPQNVAYTLLGPVGLNLENIENTRKFRDVKAAYIDAGTIEAGDPVTPDDIVEAADENKQVDPIEAPVLYAGVDSQYFAALVFPTDDPIHFAQKPVPARFVERVQPVLIDRSDTVSHSDISVQFEAARRELAPDAELTDHYTLYAGPKREALLDPVAAGETIEFGWFSWLGRGMVLLLNFLHDTLYLPYGIAIICLTIVVRGMLLPLSMKQARSAQKMKEMQPKIQELKKKYANDKEKFARAQMELFRKHNYNIFTGCLPILLQFPIFIALYNALSAAVDLRRAEFLWIENLGAPDALFDLPFTVPFLGWSEFNLLPFITVALFVVQQKMFLPEPNPDDEQAVMQYKIMKYMTVLLGFMFYHVPAGLCLYFIASSLWGMGERQFLNMQTSATAPPETEKQPGDATGGTGNGASPPRDGGPRKPGGKKSKSRR